MQLKDQRLISFKPCFRWSAPYTSNAADADDWCRNVGFKPYFRWSAPYTLVFDFI
ncbi:MAG: hypothetical protein ACLUBL_12270 [Fusobacterium sp.]|uniref:hypothetical protein n=1 Tax=Fusobacterium sp. TaxID=68766 RepID=UPI003992B0B5